MKISPRKRKGSFVEKSLIEFIWMRNHEKKLWDAFISALINCSKED